MNKYRDIVHQLISQKIQADYHMKTYFYSALSLLASIAFIIYNGILGILYGAVWNISICIYYIALFAVKSYACFPPPKQLMIQSPSQLRIYASGLPSRI